MATVMKFTGKCSPDGVSADVLVFGTLEFPNMPLFSARVSTSRVEGVSFKRHDVILSGFVRGMNHIEIRELLRSIHLVGIYNHLNFFYAYGTGGSESIVVNAQVYIDMIAEPEDWKEYNAKYSIKFHYFSSPCEDDPVGSPVTALTPDGETYTFTPQPIFNVKTENVREGPYSPSETPYGTVLGKKIIKTYTGVLCAATHSELKVKMDELDAVIRDNFVLTYGDWSNWVFVESAPTYSTPSDYTTHTTYQFVVSYYDEEIYDLKSSIVFTRQHNHPKVTPRLYCGITEVEEFHESGQYITYNLKILAIDRNKTRELLNREYQIMIVDQDPDGNPAVRMQGGTESWIGDGYMAVTGQFYYEKPVLPLVELSGAIPDELKSHAPEQEDPAAVPVP